MQPVDLMRRKIFAMLGISTSLLMLPLSVLAAAWNKAAFDAEKQDDAEKVLEINGEIPSSNISVIAPDRAENGAIVQVEIDASIANVEAIAIFVEKNPTPLIANVMLAKGARAKLTTRIKMAETSDIKVIVKADGKYFTASKNVQVLENGCGGGGSANEKFESSIKLRAKLKNDVSSKNLVTEIKAIIIHPMHTGRAKDDAGNIIPSHFIQVADLMLNDQLMFQMQWGTGIAKNPYITCYVDNAKVGDKVSLTWHDNFGATATQDIQVTQA